MTTQHYYKTPQKRTQVLKKYQSVKLNPRKSQKHPQTNKHKYGNKQHQTKQNGTNKQTQQTDQSTSSHTTYIQSYVHPHNTIIIPKRKQNTNQNNKTQPNKHIKTTNKNWW